MVDLFPFIVLGIVSGSVYGLAATGLVLTYSTSGVLNFAQGALATSGAYVFYALWVERGLPWPIAGVVSVLVLGPVMGVVLERLTRRLAQLDAARQVTATVGITLVVQGGARQWYGHDYRPFPNFLSTSTFRLGSAYVTWGQVIVVAISLGCVVGLTLLLRYTHLGLLMRAAVDSPGLLDMAGRGPSGVRRWAWVVGATFAALCGVLIAPSVTLDAVVLTLLVVQAFAAAAVGRFASIPLTYGGGLVVGVAAALATRYFGSKPSLQGLPASVPFIILFVVLLLTPRRHLRVFRESARSSATRWRPPVRFEVLSGVVAIGFFLLVPTLFGDIKLGLWTAALAWVLLFESLGFLVHTSRQVSLCHLGLAGFGAAVFAHLTVDAGIPWMVALALTGAACIPLGALIAVPAVRLAGPFLALATLAFGVMLQQMLFVQSWLFGPVDGGIPVPRPDLSFLDINSDEGYYWLCLALVAVATIVFIVLTRTRLGRLLRAMGDSPLALATSGSKVALVRVVVFCIASFFAAVAGALYAAGVRNASDTTFPPAASMLLLAILVIQPGGIPTYAILAAVGFAIVPGYIDGSQDVLTLLFGCLAVVAAVNPERVRASRFERFVDKRFAPRPKAAAPAVAADVSASRSTAVGAHGGAGGLSVRNLQVSFGGAVAVDDLTLQAPLGRITGLIGPNGAGKTTTFNACSGLLRPRRGVVELLGGDMTSLDPATRAQRGLGRTFQQTELFRTLTVRDNIRLGLEAGMARGHPIRMVMSTARDRRRIDAAVADAAEACGITHLLEQTAGQLSTGERRLVEFARCLAGDFAILLLDEPSSGLDPEESVRFGALVRSTVAERGIGILLIEHDMNLVMTVCDYIYVLDFGRLIFEGAPADVAADPTVRDAYLGDSVRLAVEVS